MRDPSRKSKAVQVTILRSGDVEKTYVAGSIDTNVALSVDPGQKVRPDYRAMLKEAERLIPGSTRDVKRLRVQACQLAISKGLTLKKALGRIQATLKSPTIAVWAKCKRSSKDKQPKYTKRQLSEEMPKWAQKLLKPDALTLEEITVALQRLRSRIESHHREGNACVLEERIVEKLAGELNKRRYKSASYVRFVQGGLPGLGKHKS